MIDGSKARRAFVRNAHKVAAKTAPPMRVDAVASSGRFGWRRGADRWIECAAVDADAVADANAMNDEESAMYSQMGVSTRSGMRPDPKK